jgi:hypothetical protein
MIFKQNMMEDLMTQRIILRKNKLNNLLLETFLWLNPAIEQVNFGSQ